jgi:polar amino acid transport system substrate-binding protein
MEKASPVGLAIDKNQTVLLDWLRDVATGMQAKLDAAEGVVVGKME